MKRIIVSSAFIVLILVAVLSFGGAVPPFTTIFMRTVLDDATQGAAQTTLGLGTSDSPQFAQLRIDDASTFIDKDGSNNMTFEDAVTGSKTLAELAAGGGVGSGTMTTVKEGNAQVGDADQVAIDFGAGFDITEDPDTETNIVLDFSEITGNVSWNDGATDASFTWTYNLSAGTDPVWTIGDNSMDLTAGVLKVAGSNVLTAAANDKQAGVDVGATPDYVGAASNDGFLRTGALLTYIDGGDFVTLDVDISKDIVAGVGLSGGEDDVLPGADADTTINLDINGLTAQADPNTNTDYVAIYDAGATAHRKVLIDNLRVLDKAKMTRDAAQSINHNTTTKIAFDNEVYDVGSIADPVTNDRFDIATDGYYLINAYVAFNNCMDAGESVILRIYIDGGETYCGIATSSGENQSVSVNLATTASLSATQTVELYATQYEQAAQNTGTGSWRAKMSVIQLQ